MDPTPGPILKDAQYFTFWSLVLGLGLLVGGTIIYLLWEILQTLRGK